MVVYALTDKCNLNCVFCSNEDFKVYFSPPDYKQPSLEETKKWFEKVSPEEDNITLTGGEPTLRDDLFEILDFLSQKFSKATIVLLTNGRRLCYNDYAERFRRLKRLEIEIPLHSHLPEVHDRLTGCPGSFQQTVQGIKNLLDNDVAVHIRVIINKQNYQQLAEFMEFLVSLRGIKRIVFINMRIKGRALENKQELVVEYRKVKPFLEEVLPFLQENHIGIQLLHFPFCILDKKYWQYTLKNPYRKEASACKACRVKEKCPGILECYLQYVGDTEFVAIK